MDSFTLRHQRTRISRARVGVGKERGFTLAELLVVTAILVVVTGVVLANNTRFGGVILLENLGYDIALSIRQAQVYGISVQHDSSGKFTSGFGVHFDKSSVPAAKTYALFADSLTVNGFYDSGELVTNGLINIERGFYVYSLCATRTGQSEDCSLNTLDIVYKRPEPDACISYGGEVTFDVNGRCTYIRTQGRIILRSPRGDLLSVIVSNNGQISVQKN